MERFTLTVEGEPLIVSPTPEQIRVAVDRMTAPGGPEFVILEGRGNDYAQAAGEEDLFTAEWREYAGESFRHWKAGLPRQATASGRNEELAASDVTAILVAYLAKQGRPQQFVWRDITAMLT